MLTVQVSLSHPKAILKACLHPFRFKLAYMVALLEEAAEKDGRDYEKIMKKDGNISIIFKNNKSSN